MRPSPTILGIFIILLGAIQVLRNAVVGRWASEFPEKKPLRRCVVQRYYRYDWWVGVEFPEKSVT